MRTDQRVVTKIPLTELWNESGAVASHRIRELNENDLVELVRFGSMQFVVADCGLQLDWISNEKYLDFWKTVRRQIADSSKPMFLASFSNETAYTASEWRGPDGKCFVLLERHHYQEKTRPLPGSRYPGG